MKKIPSIFERDEQSKRERPYIPVIKAGLEWLFGPDVKATRKWDGTAVLAQDGKIYARYDAKAGRAVPEGFIPCEEAPDPVTGHFPGWVLATRPQDIWIARAASLYALENGATVSDIPDGTYEAVGPKIGGNNDNLPDHTLKHHGDDVLSTKLNWLAGQTLDQGKDLYDHLYLHLSHLNLEGIVFHGPEGQMAKVTRKGFKLPWGHYKGEQRFTP